MKILIFATLLFSAVSFFSFAEDLAENNENKIDAKQALKMEDLLVKSPSDIDTRSKLLIYYFEHSFETSESRQLRINHVFWFIKNRPDCEIAGSPYAELDPVRDGEFYYEGKRLWLKNVKDFPKNTLVLSNAASYLTIFDQDDAEKILMNLTKLEPKNPEWKNDLGSFYELMIDDAQTAEDVKKRAAMALSQKQLAYELFQTEEKKFYILSDLANLALKSGDNKKASSYAHQLLSLSKNYVDNWNYGNAIHYAHLVLGRIAVREGQLNEANEHLVESARIKGSPQLNSFGHSMDLAKELLEKGQTSIVIKYLEMCNGFWESDMGSVEKWISEIKATGTSNFVEEYK